MGPRVNKYATNPIIRVRLNPKFIANINAVTEPTTDTVPLIPQAQGTIAWYSLSISLIPNGKNLPRITPIGKRSNMAIRILGTSCRPIPLSKIRGRK